MRHNDKADRRPLVPEISLTVLNTAGGPGTPDSPNFTPGPRFRAAVDGVRRAGGILIDPAIVAASVAEAVPTLKVPPTPEAAIDTLADAFAKIPAARALLRTSSAELARIEETVAEVRGEPLPVTSKPACPQCGHDEHEGRCDDSCMACPPCTSAITINGKTMRCVLRAPKQGRHPATKHMDSTYGSMSTWTDAEAAVQAGESR